MNNSSPLISVIMSTYNHGRYIKQAIESVLAQKTEYEFELIICDDYSTDETRDIINQYIDDPRVVCSFQKQNSRFGKNFIDGAKLIRGTYVAFCEGDDYWISDEKLQKQVSFLEQNPDFSVCCHKVQMLFSGKDSILPPQYVYKDCSADDERIRNGIFYPDEAIANYYFQTGSLVLRWAFTDGFPHWFRKRMLFDHFMLMIHAVNGKIKYIDEPMSVWRRHGGGYSWLQTRDKGLFFQKEGADWIELYKQMDSFFSNRFHYQIRERILLALRGMVSNCIQNNNIDQLRIIIHKYESYFKKPVLENACLLDAIRIAYPERPEFVPPWVDVEKKSSIMATMERPVGGIPEFAVSDIPDSDDSVWSRWVGESEYACFHNVRSALFAWLWDRGVSRVWLPSYMPLMLEDARAKSQISHQIYKVGGQLQPSASFVRELRPGDAVVTMNYLGRPLPRPLSEALAERSDILWIEDLSHSLLPREHCSDAVVYNPRKLFGVPDGGLLVGESVAALGSQLARGESLMDNERFQILMSRFEHSGQFTAADLLRYNKVGYEKQMSLRRMSRLTEAMLRRIPFADAAKKRKHNWKVLYERLGRYCLWDIPDPDFVPYAFPLRLPDEFPTEILTTLLARKNVFCERIWFPLDLPDCLFPIEQNLSQSLVALPCSQYCDENDMIRTACGVLDILAGNMDDI